MGFGSKLAELIVQTTDRRKSFEYLAPNRRQIFTLNCFHPLHNFIIPLPTNLNNMLRPLHAYFFTFCCCFFLLSCASSQPKTTVQAPQSTNKWRDLVANSPVFRQNHTGFALYDIEKQETVAEYQSDRYFTPASNTKLFTLYAGLCLLGDSIPALRYTTKGDSLLFWGTGDPSLFHPDMPVEPRFELLKNWHGHLFYYPHNYVGKRLGPVGRGAIMPNIIKPKFLRFPCTETWSDLPIAPSVRVFLRTACERRVGQMTLNYLVMNLLITRFFQPAGPQGIYGRCPVTVSLRN